MLKIPSNINNKKEKGWINKIIQMALTVRWQRVLKEKSDEVYKRRM